jgi:hypothetical protein
VAISHEGADARERAFARRLRTHLERTLPRFMVPGFVRASGQAAPYLARETRRSRLAPVPISGVRTRSHRSSPPETKSKRPSRRSGNGSSTWSASASTMISSTAAAIPCPPPAWSPR